MSQQQTFMAEPETRPHGHEKKYIHRRFVVEARYNQAWKRRSDGLYEMVREWGEWRKYRVYRSHREREMALHALRHREAELCKSIKREPGGWMQFRIPGDDAGRVLEETAQRV